MMEYDGTHKYMVVFVDEYDNWWGCGFFDDLHDALPQVNAYLGSYEAYKDRDDPNDDTPEGPIWLGPDSPFGDLCEYASTCGTCFDRLFMAECGGIAVRVFVLM